MSNEIDILAEQLEREARERLALTIPAEAVADAVNKAGWFKAAFLTFMLTHKDVEWSGIE